MQPSAESGRALPRSATLPRTSGTNRSRVARPVKQRAGSEIQRVRKDDDRTKGEVLHTRLNPLKIFGRDREPLGQRLLGESRSSTPLGDAHPYPSDGTFGVCGPHGPTVVQARSEKHQPMGGATRVPTEADPCGISLHREVSWNSLEASNRRRT